MPKMLHIIAISFILNVIITYAFVRYIANHVNNFNQAQKMGRFDQVDPEYKIPKKCNVYFL